MPMAEGVIVPAPASPSRGSGTRRSTGPAAFSWGPSTTKRHGIKPRNDCLSVHPSPGPLLSCLKRMKRSVPAVPRCTLPIRSKSALIGVRATRDLRPATCDLRPSTCDLRDAHRDCAHWSTASPCIDLQTHAQRPDPSSCIRAPPCRHPIACIVLSSSSACSSSSPAVVLRPLHPHPPTPFNPPSLTRDKASTMEEHVRSRDNTTFQA